MKKVKVLLTGGTGFLGQRVLPGLSQIADVQVISRAENAEIRGDLTRWNAGLDLEALKKNKYDIFIHLAGLYDLSASHRDVFQQNVAATGTALKVARELNIPVFINTSSVAAAINSPLQMIRPFDLNFSRPFPDPYSESKALGEQIILNQSANFRLCINMRLGVLIGDSEKGMIHRIDGPYHAFRSLEKARKLIENFPAAFPLPGKASGRLPLVPVDKAAEAILGFVKWSQETEVKGYQSFHVTPKEGLPIQDFYLKTLKHLLISHSGISLVNYIPKSILTKIAKWTVKFPEEQLNYLLMFPRYDSTKTIEILGQNWCPEFETYEKYFWRGYDEYISNR